MSFRRTLLTTMLIVLALIPVLALSASPHDASPHDEYDRFVYLPVARAGGGPAKTWSMAYGYEAGIHYRAGAVVNNDDGGFAFGGTRDDTDTTGDPRDILITRINSRGGVIWEKRFDGIYDDAFADMDRAVDGKVIVTGSAIGETTKSRDTWFAKLDDDGSIIWQKLFSAGSTSMWVQDIQATADGGFVAVGHADSGDGGLWIVKMNGAGTLQWQRQYIDIYAASIAIVEDGQDGYFVGGTWHWDTYGLDIHVQRLDSDGKIIWQKAIGESAEDDWFMALDSASDGGLFVAGITAVKGDPFPTYLFWFMKLDEDGKVQWHKRLVGEWEMINALRAAPGGGFLATGTTAGGDIWLLKMNDDGTVAWQRVYQGAEWDEPRDLQLVSSGGYILAGQTRSYGSGDVNSWLLRLDEAGAIASCSIDEAGKPVLEAFDLPLKVPAITAVELDWAVSAGDLASSDNTVRYTVVCKAATASAARPVDSCR